MASTASKPRHNKAVDQSASEQQISSSNSDPKTPSQDVCKARRRLKRSKKSKHAGRHLRQFMQSVSVDGDAFSVGDSVYVRMTNSLDVDAFAEEEVCQVCGQAEPEEVPRLECDRCLQGYHLTCLDPPLTEVPKVCTTE